MQSQLHLTAQYPLLLAWLPADAMLLITLYLGRDRPHPPSMDANISSIASSISSVINCLHTAKVLMEQKELRFSEVAQSIPVVLEIKPHS